MDELYLENPCYGNRKYMNILRRMGFDVGRKLIRRLMQVMGIVALYQKPRTSIPEKLHLKYPYLLKGLKIERANQVWTSDITYIPMETGFMYLTVVQDWYSRKILSWCLSNTMDVALCIEVLEGAIERYGKPEIFNTDQGSQYTSEKFINILKSNEVQISMDGKGRYLDNIMNERLWRTVKYEHIYRHRFEEVKKLKSSLLEWLNYYNTKRLHQGLDYKTPDEIYYGLNLYERDIRVQSQESSLNFVPLLV